MKNIPTLVPVVAAALIDGAGRVLLQQRRAGGRHGGLWEFPGGKVEAGEAPKAALLREVAEELGVAVAQRDLRFAIRSADPGADPSRREPYVLTLYTCRRWRGEPRCLAAAAIAWFSPAEAAALAVPPLDVPLVAALPRLVCRA